MTEQLGPLCLVGDRWIIGDPDRKKGSCLVLTPEGMEHHKQGVPEPLTVVPWSRFMGLDVDATKWAWMASPAVRPMSGSLVSAGGACLMSALLRNPYVQWSVYYAHHKRPYPSGQIFLMNTFISQTVEAKAVHRLGDPEWLGRAVERLAPLPAWYAPSARRRVAEIMKELGT